MIRRLALISALLAVAVSVSGCAELMAELPNAIKESQAPPHVTPEEFGQVEEGMTEAEVVAIVGEPPKEVMAVPRKDGVEEKILQWTNYDGSIMFVTVKDGVVTEKDDYDLVNKVEK